MLINKLNCCNRKHLETHNESRKYCCHICGMLFKTASYLQYHVHLHSGRKQFSCPHCSKEFNQSNHLKQHVRIHTGIICNFCMYIAIFVANIARESFDTSRLARESSNDSLTTISLNFKISIWFPVS